MASASAWASSRMISSTPRHCWKSGGAAGHIRVTRPPVCWARRVAKRRATLHSGVRSITTRNLRGARDAGLLMERETNISIYSSPWPGLTRPSNFVPRDGKLDGRLKAGHGEGGQDFNLLLRL